MVSPMPNQCGAVSTALARRSALAATGGLFGWLRRRWRVTAAAALSLLEEAFSALVPGYFDPGSSWYAEPSTGTTGILLTTRSFASPEPPPVVRDSWRRVNGSVRRG